MYPLKDWEQIPNGPIGFLKPYPPSFGHLAGRPHLGIDKLCKFLPLFAPFDGVYLKHISPDQGNAVHIRPDNSGVLIRLMHNNRYCNTLAQAKNDVWVRVKKGEQIAVTGNSGFTEGTYHVHCDLYDMVKGDLDVNKPYNFVDPGKFDWFFDEKKTLIQKVLILCKDLPGLEQLQQGIKAYTELVTQKTNGEFGVEVDYALVDPNAYFGLIQYGETIYLQPHDISLEGHRVELLNHKEYDVVCLIYDNSKMNPKPNHPVEAQQMEFGFNTIQIPLNWISNANLLGPIVIFPEAVTLFFAHEMSHADYYLANLKGANQRDKTHDLVNLNAEKPSPLDYFLDYLMELKPWWKYL